MAYSADDGPEIGILLRAEMGELAAFTTAGVRSVRTGGFPMHPTPAERAQIVQRASMVFEAALDAFIAQLSP